MDNGLDGFIWALILQEQEETLQQGNGTLHDVWHGNHYPTGEII
jgi:hypothetical protein